MLPQRGVICLFVVLQSFTLAHTHTYTHTHMHIYTHRYGIIYDKGYQKSGSVSGTVTTKMKGAYLFNNSDEFMDGCEDYFNLSSFSVYDPADYVIPPQVSGMRRHCTAPILHPFNDIVCPIQ